MALEDGDLRLGEEYVETHASELMGLSMNSRDTSMISASGASS